MAKLYFRYGTVSSAKSLNLLAVVHNYQVQNKKVILMKPRLDIRFGEKTVRSRAGLEKEADFLIDENSHKTIDSKNFEDVSCIIVDEAQFLPPEFVEFLRNKATESNIPVICYGLRTDFTQKLFAGAQRLFELADTIEEVKTVCHYCNKKSIFNLKLVDGAPTLGGPQVDLGTEEKYLPVCSSHYHEAFL